MANKYLDSTGLAHLWSKIKAWVANYTKITTSDGTSTLTVGSTDVTIPSKTSQITNDSGYITSADVPEGAAASMTSPLMDGTAAVGTETAFARGDHRHPTDTTRQAVIDDLATIRSGASAGATAYQKPSTGIPSSDMANAVQTSLGKADTAYQKPSTGIPASDMATAVQTALTAAGNAIPSSQKGAANGVATLDANGKVPSDQLPSYVDDVIEVYARSGQTALSQNWFATGSASGTVVTPEAGKIYVLMADSGDYTANSQFRWGGTAYVKLNDGGVSTITNAEIDSITAN